jgi:flagellar basal body-associated protein FliL
MGNSNKNRKRGKSGWRIAIIVIAGVTLLACGLLITLDVRKVSVEKKVDRQSAKEKTLSNVAPELPLQPQPDNN